MDHDLAKKLKDADFPQNYQGSGNWFDDESGEPSPAMLLSSRRDFDLSRCSYVPTLEELIEACEKPGYFNFEIGHFREWMAKIIENSSTKSLIEATAFGVGATPIEAVARLWLALQSNGAATA